MPDAVAPAVQLVICCWFFIRFVMAIGVDWSGVMDSSWRFGRWRLVHNCEGFIFCFCLFVFVFLFLSLSFCFCLFGLSFWFVVGFSCSLLLSFLTCWSCRSCLFIVMGCHPWRVSMPVPGTTSHFLKGAKTNEKRLSHTNLPCGSLRDLKNHIINRHAQMRTSCALRSARHPWRSGLSLI